MKIKHGDVAVVVDFSGAQIPVFRQIRREIDAELAKRGHNASDGKLLDQVALDRYAMELTNKLLSNVQEAMIDPVDVGDVEVTQELIDNTVEECWGEIWEAQLDPNEFGFDFAIFNAAGADIPIAGTGKTLFGNDPDPRA
jgi:hypothetical protein